MSESARKPRIPLPCDNIQVNHCKHPDCINFGVAASLERSNAKKERSLGHYSIIGNQNGSKVLACHGCKRYTTIRSNVAIKQELDRFDPSAQRAQQACCQNEGCSSFGRLYASSPDLYYKHGITHSGQPRYRCRHCGSTFVAGPSIRRQRRPELNSQVIKLLVNKVPMRRICEVLDINAATLYNKLSHLAEVTSELTVQYEALLADPQHAPSRAYISVDRQDHTLNWLQGEIGQKIGHS